MAKLYIIAGHGEGDSGAVGNGYQEQERVRALAKRIVELGNGQVDHYPYERNCYARGDMKSINPGCPIIELHLDSATGARGGHVIIPSDYGGADAYDNKLAAFVSGMFPGRSRTIVERSDLYNPNVAKSRGLNYRLLECCFITSSDDMAVFNANIDKLAKGILDAFGIASKAEEDMSKVVQLWASNGGDAQKFIIHQFKEGTIGLKVVKSGKYLDVEDSKYKSGTPVIAWRSTAADNQRFVIIDRGEGLVSIHPKMDKTLCLDVTGGKGNVRDRIQLWTYNTKTMQRNQVWHKCPNEDGTYTFLTALDTKLALDVVNGGLK